MGENRLNGLVLLNIYCKIKVKPEYIKNLFVKQHSRHLQLR